MKLARILMVPLAAIVLASLAACGGGSTSSDGPTDTAASVGSGSTSVTVDHPVGTGTASTTSALDVDVAFVVTPADSSRHGLSISAYRDLDATLVTLQAVAENLHAGLKAGPAMAAARALGRALVPYSTVGCSSGTVSDRGDGGFWLTRCVVDDFELTGLQVSVTGTVGDTYTVQGANTVAVGQGPGYAQAVSLNGVTGITCSRVDGGTQCLIGYQDSNGVDYEFGWDSSVSILASGTGAGNVAINGTHDCGCDRAWLVTYADFTALSGRALVEGANGQKAEFVRRDTDVYDIVWTDGAITRRFRLAQGVLTEV